MKYYDRTGHEISDTSYWAYLYEDDDYRLVEQTGVDEETTVSTVWLGLDHNFESPGDPPLVFETMIFGGPHDLCQWRWATEEDAKKAHAMIVAKLREEAHGKAQR